MGCDGGTIPKRHELVRMKKKPEQKDKDMERSAKWSQCSISQEQLKPPIVSCELGLLYNKDAVIEYLLSKDASICASHLRNLRDIKELNLTTNLGFQDNKGELADQYHDTQASKYMCPVVGIEMNGKYKFCFLWSCGCVMSEKALKEVPGNTCHKCGGAFTENDIIYLNPEGDDSERMREKMGTRREAAKQAKKAKKDKKKSANCSKVESSEAPDTCKKVKETKGVQAVVNGEKRPACDETSSLQIKKTKEEKAPKRGSTTKATKETASVSSANSLDPTQRKVYKSIFTSSEQAKGRPEERKAHWITYNPYHL